MSKSIGEGPSIELSVEAGDWPREADLRTLADAAVAAAWYATRSPGSPENPSPTPPHEGEGDIPSRLVARLLALPGHLRQGGRAGASELSILFTDDAHIRRLNAEWRGQDKPTNVLSFPQAPGPRAGTLLGDIILAYETVRNEAALAGKPLEAHMAHLIVHGFLHLLGHDHEDEAEAELMEALERAALDRIGIADPYAPAQD